MKINTMPFDNVKFRQQFPYFQQENTAVYLDSAATTLKPQVLIDATTDFYLLGGSVHRSQYEEKQTALYEQARTQVKELIHAESENAVIWTSGCTHGINLVANGLLHQFCPQDEIIITTAEHHANFVPWQQLAKKSGAKLVILPVEKDGMIDEQALAQVLNSRTKLVALNWVSNITGTKQSIASLIPLIRQKSTALVLVDAAQAICHFPIDLQTADIDFISFSAHKFYGPTGLGVLSGKLTALEQLQPLMFGGKMVEQVSNSTSRFSKLPYRLEAGTPNTAAVIGFSAVLTWFRQWDQIAMEKYTQSLAKQIVTRLQNYALCRIFSSPQSSILSFVFEHIENSDLATLLAEQNIAIRVGKHCAEPYINHLNLQGTLRISLAPYNNQQDIDNFFTALDKALSLLEIE